MCFCRVVTVTGVVITTVSGHDIVMLIRCGFLIRWMAAGVLVVTGIPGVSAVDLPGRSISSSGQFVIYAEQPILRISASSAAEQSRQALDKVFKDKRAAWELPVVITVRPRPVALPAVSPAQVRAVQTVQGIRIEINIWTGPSPVPVDFHRRVVHALLLERALRGQGATLPAKMADVPVWLVLGLAEMTSSDSLARSVYAGLLDTGNIPELDVFVTNPPPAEDASLDAIVYRAYAAALVSAVLAQDGGPDRLAAIVSDSVLNPSPGGLASLREGFETAGGIEPFRRQWALALAALSRRDALDFLTAEESSARLREALDWPLATGTNDGSGGAVTVALREAHVHKRTRMLSNQLREASARLLADAATANPIVAPLYGDLAALCAATADGKAKDPGLVLARIESALDEISRLAADITDHINWIEATQVRPADNPFESYFRAVEEFGSKTNLRPHRGGDPVAAYLDGMERILE